MRRNLLALTLLLSLATAAQTRFSLSTDMRLLRNFSPRQKFFAIGQEVAGHFHVTPRQSAYVLLTYFAPGSFANTYSATAKSASTTPQQLDYRVRSKWRFREVSLGWTHYFRGSFSDETTWHLYGQAGLGLLFTRVENSYNKPVDTLLYQRPERPRSGNSSVKRLNLDLGIGAEWPVGPGIFVYGTLKTWIPTTSYPSEFLHDTRGVPRAIIAGGGIRILFE